MFRAFSHALEYKSLNESLTVTSNIIRKAGQAASVVGHIPIPVFSTIAKATSELLTDYANVLTPNSNVDIDMQKTKKEISEQLKLLERKIVFVIDDIDRLNKTEIRQIFQAVKSLGDFPNTIYVLLFDKGIVVESLADVQAGDGEEYLKKIVQMPIALPMPEHKIIYNHFNNMLDHITEQYPQHRLCFNYIKHLLEYKSPFLQNIRDVNRLFNRFQFKYALIEAEVYFEDLLALTILEEFVPRVYELIKSDKYLFLGRATSSPKFSHLSVDDLNEEFYLNYIRDYCGKYDPNLILSWLCYMFPSVHYGVNDIAVSYYNTERSYMQIYNGISYDKTFDYYFYLALPEGQITLDFKEHIYQIADESEIVKALSQDCKQCDELLYELLGFMESISVERGKIISNALKASYPKILELENQFRRNNSAFRTDVSDKCRRVLSRLLQMQPLNEQENIFILDPTVHQPITLILLLDVLTMNERMQEFRTGKHSPDIYGMSSYKELLAIESNLLRCIETTATADFLNGLSRGHFEILIFAWEKMDKNGTMIIDRLKQYIGGDINLCRLISQKIIQIFDISIQSHHPYTYNVDIPRLEKYILAKDAYVRLAKIISTPAFHELDDGLQIRIQAFMSYCEDSEIV